MSSNSKSSSAQKQPFPEWSTLAECAQRHLPLCFVAGCLFAGIGTAAAVFCVPAHYKATAMVRLGDPKGLVDTPHESSTAEREFRHTQKELIRMPHVIQRALETPQLAELEEARGDPETVKRLADSIELELPRSSEILRISISRPRAEDAYLLTNAVTDAYLKEIRREHKEEYERRLAALDQLHVRAEARLSDAWYELQSLAKQLGCGDPAALSLQAQAEIENYRAYARRLREIRAEKRDADRVIESLTVSPEMLKQEVPENASMHNVKFGMFTAKLKREKALAKYGKNHPDVLAAEQEEGLLRKYYQDATSGEALEHMDPKERVRAETLGTLANLKHEEEALESLIRDMDHRLELLGGDNATKLEMLRQNICRMEKLCDRIWQTRENLQVERHAAHRVQPVSYSSLPTEVDTAKRDKLVMMLAAAGFGLGVFLIAIGEFLTGRIHSIRDAQKRTGVEILGTLTTLPCQVASESEIEREALDRYDRLHRELDVIAARLVHHSTTANAQSILASNATSSEGSVRLVDHLAAAFARSGKKTILVDLDFRNPHPRHDFRRQSAEGVSELIFGKTCLEDLPLATGIPQLDFLPAGQAVTTPLPIFTHPAFAEFFDRLKQGYAHVIVAAPAVLEFADALHVARFVDVAMLPILRNTSRSNSIVQAKERLEATGIPVLGAFVLGPCDANERPRSAPVAQRRRRLRPKFLRIKRRPADETPVMSGTPAVNTPAPSGAHAADGSGQGSDKVDTLDDLSRLLGEMG